jgi:hypothetical protein
MRQVASTMYAVVATENYLEAARAFFEEERAAEIFCGNLNDSDDRGCEYAVQKVWLMFSVRELVEEE